MATRAPNWTDGQAAAMAALRASFASGPPPPPAGDNPRPSAHERLSRLPSPEAQAALGVKITAHLSPPATDQPAEVLKDAQVVPEPVPCFVYRAAEDAAAADGDAGGRALPIAADRKAVFFVHGGGGVHGSAVAFEWLPTLSALVRRLHAISPGALVIAPEYRLARTRDTVFPAALQDVLGAWAWLMKEGYNPADVTIAGDSAGGNLALVTTHLLSQMEDGPGMPGRMALIAPAADSTYTFGPTAIANASLDLFNRAAMQAMSAQWLGLSGAPTHDPASPPHYGVADAVVSPAHVSAFAPPARWAGKTLVVVGGADQLVEASRAVVRKLREAGREVEYEELEGMPHVFWALKDVFPQQADAAWDAIARVVTA